MTPAFNAMHNFCTAAGRGRVYGDGCRDRRNPAVACGDHGGLNRALLSMV